MSKHKISSIDKEKIDGKANEHELFVGILKKEFFEWMENNGYSEDDIKEIFEGKKISSVEQNEFNNTIRKLKKETNIQICEVILFIEEYYAKFKKILDVFDSETKFELKKELSKKYHIEIDKNSLNEILG